MPIYEYECKKCGHRLEVWQKFSDSPLTKCESCNGKLRKIISQNSFHLKGTGWYVTDYCSKGGSPSGKKKDGPAADSKKSESATGQSKDQSTGSSAKADS
jgi:putative FmdB family regulatory protein